MMQPNQRAIGNRYGRETAIETLRCIGCPVQLTEAQVSAWPMITQNEYATSGLCRQCQAVVFQEDLTVCICDSPCCEADTGIGGVITCGSQHCPVHGIDGAGVTRWRRSGI